MKSTFGLFQNRKTKIISDFGRSIYATKIKINIIQNILATILPVSLKWQAQL
jgi:hypothetical protein